ncbi:hypothetical protein JHK82_042887 [Glycine max]|nr:hypothetical protein JHK82_042887 [Glycine max]
MDSSDGRDMTINTLNSPKMLMLHNANVDRINLLQDHVNNSRRWNCKPELSDFIPRVAVITSSKGSVGKTTTTANIGLSLARLGFSIVAIDVNVGLRKLLLGLENRINYIVIKVLNGNCYLVRDNRLSNFKLNTSRTSACQPSGWSCFHLRPAKSPNLMARAVTAPHCSAKEVVVVEPLLLRPKHGTRVFVKLR